MFGYLSKISPQTPPSRRLKSGFDTPVGLIVLAGLAVGFGGCKATEPSDRPVSEAGVPWAVSDSLSADEQAEARGALQSFAEGAAAPEPQFGIAPEGRWSDVPAALAAAGDHPQVQLVIADSQQTESAWVFDLVTADDRPGRVVIERHDDPMRFVFTEAWLGRFDRPADRDRIEALKRHFQTEIKRLGRKPRFYE